MRSDFHALMLVDLKYSYYIFTTTKYTYKEKV